MTFLSINVASTQGVHVGTQPSVNYIIPIAMYYLFLYAELLYTSLKLSKGNAILVGFIPQ